MTGNTNRTDGLAAFAEHTTDVVWIVNHAGMICYSNKHWRRFAGIGDNEILNCEFPPKEYIHREDIQKLQTTWDAARSAVHEFSMEVRLLNGENANYVWHLLRGCPMFMPNADSTVPQWLTICTDVNALKATQNMFQLVMDNIPISIFWKDRNSVYLGCNKSFSMDMGVESTEDMIGRNDYDNDSTKEQSDFFIQCDKRVMESGNPEYHIIEPQQRFGNQQCWVDTNKIPLRDAGGSVFGVLGMYEDITKRILQERQREDFVATITHDLKNPILGANRILDLLVNGKLGTLSDEQKQVLNQLKGSNISLLSLIRNLTDVYKHDTVAILSDLQEVDLMQFLQESIERHQVTADSREIKLTLTLNGDSKSLRFNKQAMSRVLQNLIDNALKFAPQNGCVDVTAKIFSNYYSIEVKDNGPGIELEEQRELFHRFAQGAHGKQLSGGSGLGLYLCKQIIEAHKGNISCQSFPGNGAAFVVVLPINFDSSGGSAGAND